MSDPLVPPRMLYHFAAPCRYRAGPLWDPQGLDLADDCRLPTLAELDGQPALADVRAAWSEQGLVFSAHVRGKRQHPWCRENSFDDSDGLHLWIDTRDTHNIHRASRFCHRFVFLPSGGGRRRDEPALGQLLINRAREHPRPAAPSQLAVRCEHRVDGYLLEAHVSAGAMTGYQPDEHPRLGFTYALVDRELGEQTFTVGGAFPYREDPSLWGTLELVR